MKKSLLKRPGQALRLTAVACGLLGLLLRFWLEVDAIDDRKEKERPVWAK